MTPKQTALIHLAAKQLGFDEDLYRTILKVHGGVESAKDLDAPAFKRVMAYFTAHGFRSTWTQRTFGKRPGMASPQQIDAIRRLWEQWSGQADEAALSRWLERSYRVSSLRFLTPASAANAINGLKAMVKRRNSRSTTGQSGCTL